MSGEMIVEGVYQIRPSNAFVVDGDEGVVLADTLVPRKKA